MDIKQLYKLYSKNFLIDTDSRHIRKGSLFFALNGENFNGNKFALKAIENGAEYAIIDESIYHIANKTFLVENALETLQQLANYHRKKLSLPIISLTGSNGKTTTKELVRAVLTKKFNVMATKGNLNNHIGVPLTLLSMNANTEMGIVEMGANHLKEIELLCEIAEPNYGYITNFGKAHLEGFGGIEGVIKGKSELYNFLGYSEGIAFLNTDDQKQVEQSKGINTIDFSSREIPFLDANPFVSVKFKDQTITSQLIGKYNYHNIAAAIAIGNYFNVPCSDIKTAIENYVPSNNRSQIIMKGTNRVILDAYNANPSSMEVALENFSQLTDKQKIVILGDMFELGESSASEHQKIAALATNYNFDQVYLIGKAFSTTNVKNAFIFKDFESFKTIRPKLNIENSTILIKGSRGMALERSLDLL